MHQTLYRPPSLSDFITVDEWKKRIERQWRQGEHVAIIGTTGTGKTTIAQPLLECRQYVVALALKKQDETLERFKNGVHYGMSPYRVIRKWPPDYPMKRVIFWPKPKDIGSHDEQAERVYKVFNAIYMSGGWCLYADDCGYISGSLGLGRALGVLLNQGRSAHISVVAAMTRPSSVVASVPKEAFNQCRHLLIFKYTDEREMKTCAQIAGITYRDMLVYQEMLQWHTGRNGKRYSDFLYVYDNEVILVENVSRDET